MSIGFGSSDILAVTQMQVQDQQNIQAFSQMQVGQTPNNSAVSNQLSNQIGGLLGAGVFSGGNSQSGIPLAALIANILSSFFGGTTTPSVTTENPISTKPIGNQKGPSEETKAKMRAELAKEFKVPTAQIKIVSSEFEPVTTPPWIMQCAQTLSYKITFEVQGKSYEARFNGFFEPNFSLVSGSIKELPSTTPISPPPGEQEVFVPEYLKPYVKRETWTLAKELHVRPSKVKLVRIAPYGYNAKNDGSVITAKGGVGFGSSDILAVTQMQVQDQQNIQAISGQHGGPRQFTLVFEVNGKIYNRVVSIPSFKPLVDPKPTGENKPVDVGRLPKKIAGKVNEVKNMLAKELNTPYDNIKVTGVRVVSEGKKYEVDFSINGLKYTRRIMLAGVIGAGGFDYVNLPIANSTGEILKNKIVEARNGLAQGIGAAVENISFKELKPAPQYSNDKETVYEVTFLVKDSPLVAPGEYGKPQTFTTTISIPKSA